MNKFVLSEKNYFLIPDMLKRASEKKTSSVDIFVVPKQRMLLKKEWNFIMDILLFYEKYFQIYLKNIPFCLIRNTGDRLIVNDFSSKKTQLKQCKKCRYRLRCGGVPKDRIQIYKNHITPMPDLPREIMIEVTPRCNFNCRFCFNKSSFAKNGRNAIPIFDSVYLKRLLKKIAEASVSIVRLTGGEPMLREDIFELMVYAKKIGLNIRLNTNGILINSPAVVKKLNKYISSILIPIESFNNKKESQITNYKDSLTKKIRAIKLLKKHGDMFIRVGTVATRDNIDNLEKIFNLVINKLKVHDWEIYRPMSLESQNNEFNRKDTKKLVDKLLMFYKKTGRLFRIVNGVPFCSYDPKKIEKISNGALSIDGHIRYAIDPRGFAKPDYYIDKNIGNPLDIKGCWEHPFMEKMRNLKFVPRKCKDCKYLIKCRGGSRFSAKIAHGSYSAKDPLMK